MSRSRFGRLLAAAAVLLTACGPGPAPGTAITELDHYVDDQGSAAWQQVLDGCAAETGTVIRRERVPVAQLLPKVLRDAGAHALPDLLFADNPALQQIAATGALTPLAGYGITAGGSYPGIVAAGTYRGTLYGAAPGVDALALFYDRDALAAAGVRPPSTWDDLKTAAAALTRGGRYGLAFSAVASEEGTWQFLPFFWGRGARLSQVDSPQAVAALGFVADLVAAGSVSRSVVTWNQDDVADRFAAGEAAMMINGSWNLARLDARGTRYGVVPVPVPHAGEAPAVALGGEVGAVPVTGEATQRAAGRVLSCLLAEPAVLRWSAAHAYVPAKTAVAARFGAQRPSMRVFVDEVATARARTADLGERYPKVSQALADAIQAALTGQRSPADALREAQRAAGS